MTHRSLLASATGIARAIRTREWSSREVIDAHIACIERVNPTLNAVVAERFDRARAEADAADRAIERGEALGALHGVPCTIKEAFALEGMPNSAGLVARKHIRATKDATAVHRLRRAGAIPLGVTNTSELCMWIESDNRVYGRTGSAFAPDRTCGGSSGGEGAIVGAGGSPFGLGSDIGGSIRIPAFFNGVFGHKPSGGRVPGTGQFPIAHGSALRMLTTGPLTRRAEDLAPLLALLEGPDGEDEACVAMPSHPIDPHASLRSLRVFVVDEPAPLRASSALRAAVDRAASALSNAGAIVERRPVPALRAAIEHWAAALSSAGGPSFAEMLGQGTRIQAGRELLRALVGRSAYTVPALALVLIEKVPALLGDKSEQVLRATAALRRELDAMLGEDGVMLFPPYARTAPKHGRPLWVPVQWGHTAVFNALELPVTQVPLGLDRDGVPLGVQVVGAHAMDHQCIRVAIALEEFFGGWSPPAWTQPS